MRLSSDSGGIIWLNGNRRKPYAARVTIGWEGGKQNQLQPHQLFVESCFSKPQIHVFLEKEKPQKLRFPGLFHYYPCILKAFISLNYPHICILRVYLYFGAVAHKFFPRFGDFPVTTELVEAVQHSKHTFVQCFKRLIVDFMPTGSAFHSYQSFVKCNRCTCNGR